MIDLPETRNNLFTNEPFKDSAVSMRISIPVLEDICKKMIEVILFCLPQAIRGTIYKVGPMPRLRVVLVASGRRQGATDEILWNGHTQSDYDFPGKVWKDYADLPGRALEAMAWCVERQRSWTADDPENNARSKRKQLEGKAWEDYHHMEPVLVEKTDLWDEMPSPTVYPKNNVGKPIWQDSNYATVAVIKIHFLPGCVRRNDRVTRIIKELSRSLGTQMLSLHARETTVQKEKKLTEARQETCNTLAHEFRNLTPKIGFAYRVINNEIAYLRESWENLIHDQLPGQPNKRTILKNLNEILREIEGKCTSVNPSVESLTSESGLSTDQVGCQGVSDEISRLFAYQNQLMISCLLPRKNKRWLDEKIRPMWDSVLSKTNLNSTMNDIVKELLQKLGKSFDAGLDRKLIDKIEIVPEDIKAKWVELAYHEMNGNNNGIIQEYINLLKSMDLNLPRKDYSLKNFIYLKHLVELIPEIEKKLNNQLELLKNSGKRRA